MFSPLLYILLPLVFLLVPGFIISLWFLFQRKKWQRVIAGLAGLDFLVLVVTGSLPRFGHYHEIEEVHKLYLELGGFLWLIIVLLLPGKKENKEVLSSELKEKPGQSKINALVFIFSVQFIFKLLSVGYHINTVFADKWENSYSNFGLLILCLFLAGIILFYFRKGIGWLLLISYFVYAGWSTLVYMAWLIYEQNTQSLYRLEVSFFSYLHLVYYIACITFLFRKDILSSIHVDKKYILITFVLSSILAFILFWNNYLN